MHTVYELNPTSIDDHLRKQLDLFYLTQSSPMSPPETRFIIQLPENFQPEKLGNSDDLSKNHYINIATFAQVESPEVHIDISLRCLPQEVNLRDWIRVDAEKSVSQILQWRVINDGIDLLLHEVNNGNSFLSRRRLVQNGNYIFCITATSPEERYNQHFEKFFLILESFQALFPSTFVTNSEQANLEKDITNKISFKYPSNWNQEDTTKYDKQLLFRFNNLSSGVSVGRMIVEFESMGGDDHELTMFQRYLGALKQTGIRLNGVPMLACKPKFGFDNAWIYDPLASYQGEKLVTISLVLRQGTTYVLIGLLSPAYDIAPEWWAINKRAFEIVRDSLCII